WIMTAHTKCWMLAPIEPGSAVHFCVMSGSRTLSTQRRSGSRKSSHWWRDPARPADS
ncbi:MAG: hypothetical protein AVDCRST_MAG43-2265, partial [uncultured Thermomicrobiales bacterium]